MAAFVQVKSVVLAAGSTTIVATFPGTVGAGNAVCGVIGYDTGLTLTTVTDDKSNTYTIQRTVTDGGNAEQASLFYLANITNGPITVTATFNGVTNNGGMTMLEGSGIVTSSALDVETGQLQATPGTGANGVTSGAVTTTVAGDFVCGFAVDTGAFRTGTQYAAGTGFTKPANGESGDAAGHALDNAGEYQIQGSAGSIAATWTAAANDATISFVIALKASGGGGLTAAQVMPAIAEAMSGGVVIGRVDA